jgi:hypothetical protein
VLRSYQFVISCERAHVAKIITISVFTLAVHVAIVFVSEMILWETAFHSQDDLTARDICRGWRRAAGRSC